jgi:hypothetical protein
MFGWSWARFSTRGPVVVSHNIRGFSQSLQVNVGIVLKIDYIRFLLYHSKFMFYISSLQLRNRL